MGALLQPIEENESVCKRKSVYVCTCACVRVRERAKNKKRGIIALFETHGRMRSQYETWSCRNELKYTAEPSRTTAEKR